MKDYSVGSTLVNEFLPAINPVDPAKTGMIFGWRTLSDTFQLIRSVGPVAQPPNYEPIHLDSYTDGTSALLDLKSRGFQYTIGLSFDTTFINPDHVTTDNSTGLVTLTWDTATMGIQYLLTQNPTGSVTQGETTSATIRTVNIIGNTSIMVVVPVEGSTDFNTVDSIVVTATLTNPAPNPGTSDNICVAVYWYFQQYITARKFATSPDLWISVAIAGRDTDINPADEPITLVTPNTVAVQSDGSINLSYSLTAANLGLLPLDFFGSSTISQSVTLPSNTTQTVYYAGGKYLQGSAASTGANYSTDGANWTACTGLTTHEVFKFYWNGSVFVAGTNAGLWYSVNGIAWTQSATNTGTFKDVYFANTKWVAASAVGLFYSSDGITWTGSGGDDNANFVALTYGVGTAGGLWIAVTANADAYKSSDGITFSALTISSSGFNSAYFANGLFQLGGNADGVVYSTDGTTFTASNLTTLSVYTFMYDNTLSLWLAGTSVGIYTSTNGLVWTIATGVSTGIFKTFATNSTEWVAGSAAGIYRSVDGLTWAIALGSGATGSYTSIIHHGALFIAGDAGGLSNSSDGITWITGSVSISATYNGYTLSSTALIINALDPTATFNTTNAITVNVDSSTDGFSYIDNDEISSFAIAANIPNNTVLTTNYPAFVAGVTAQQVPGAVARKKYNAQGYFGYAFTQPNDQVLSTMTAPDSPGWVATVRLDVPTIYQYPGIGFVQAVQHMFTNLNNQDPYYDDSGKGAIVNQQVSSSRATLPKNTAADQLTGQGWTVNMPSTTGLLYVYRDVSCMQTDGGNVDAEYRYQAVQLKVRWLDKNLVVVGDATCLRPDGSRDNNNPELEVRLNTNLQNVLTVGNDEGMLGAGGTLVITLSTIDVTRFNVVATVSIVSSNSGIDFLVVVRPYTI